VERKEVRRVKPLLSELQVPEWQEERVVQGVALFSSAHLVLGSVCLLPLLPLLPAGNLEIIDACSFRLGT
jgi:hypothetical protein